MASKKRVTKKRVSKKINHFGVKPSRRNRFVEIDLLKMSPAERKRVVRIINKT